MNPGTVEVVVLDLSSALPGKALDRACVPRAHPTKTLVSDL